MFSDNEAGPYTVFAPTNDAFYALYKMQGVDGITDLPAELVKNVLLYHVVKGNNPAGAVVSQSTLPESPECARTRQGSCTLYA